ncbi:hypothetical protein GGP78_003239 [Salinibacter ruber]|jgi:hypothetical protein|uniref:hypothetical protein n=1 Tax=Salinibacter ruber TaxID=146919 RepID=UPI002169D7BD|nr:hypothetical protein [Salinibacter ruber]MCS3856535.1 hypothetical protein [Salinibacter ruber]
MSEDPTGDSESDLPSADSGETFSDVNSLKERLSGGASDTSSAEQPEAGEGQGQSPKPDSGESDGPERDSQSDSSGGSDTVRMTFHVDRETAERLRNAVYWTATPVTLSGTARDALKAAVRQLEEEYNDGEPFPDRDAELKGGNPNLK